MSRLRRTRMLRWVVGASGIALLVTLAASVDVRQRFANRILSIQEVPAAPVAVVFGAGLSSGREPSPVLAARLRTAVSLYRLGKIQRLLLSGDDSDRRHDETHAMLRFIEDQGVPANALLRDVAGFSTYDSCYRAREVFGVRRAVLVSQAFHLPRALFIANSLGIDAYGVAADSADPKRALPKIREVFARALAWVMVALRPVPKSISP